MSSTLQKNLLPHSHFSNTTPLPPYTINAISFKYVIEARSEKQVSIKFEKKIFSITANPKISTYISLEQSFMIKVFVGVFEKICKKLLFQFYSKFLEVFHCFFFKNLSVIFLLFFLVIYYAMPLAVSSVTHSTMFLKYIQQFLQKLLCLFFHKIFRKFLRPFFGFPFRNSLGNYSSS